MFPDVDFYYVWLLFRIGAPALGTWLFIVVLVETFKYIWRESKRN